MLIEVIEKYFEDIEGICLWKWLGIAQTTWSTMKKKGISDKHMNKILKHLFGEETLSEKDMLIKLVTSYYNK